MHPVRPVATTTPPLPTANCRTSGDRSVDEDVTAVRRLGLIFALTVGYLALGVPMREEYPLAVGVLSGLYVVSATWPMLSRYHCAR